MISVEVSFFSGVRALIDDAGIIVDLPEESSVADLLRKVVGVYGRDLMEYLFDGEGRIQSYVVVILNGRGIGVLNGEETALRDGDRVSILPAIGGG